MLSRNEYVDILETLIGIYTNDYFSQVIRNNDDIYNDLLVAVMEADWKHELDDRGHTENYGFRRNMFLWKLGKIKREYSRPKNHYYQCASFDHWPDYTYEANDTNMFFEEFREDINKSTKLDKKEKKCLVGKFIEMKEKESLHNMVVKVLYFFS